MAFKCPVCDGETWGTQIHADGKYERHCHGYVDAPELGNGVRKPCPYSWFSEEDAENGIEPPSSEEVVGMVVPRGWTPRTDSG